MSKQLSKRRSHRQKRQKWHRQPKTKTFAKHVGRQAQQKEDKAELVSEIKTLRAKQHRLHQDFDAKDRKIYHELRLRCLAG